MHFKGFQLYVALRGSGIADEMNWSEHYIESRCEDLTDDEAAEIVAMCYDRKEHQKIKDLLTAKGWHV